MVGDTSTSAYTSYRDFLERNVESWPRYRWMQIFFNDVTNPPRGDTRITAFDSTGKDLVQTSFSFTDPTRFQNFLDSRPAAVKSRIVILAYNETWSVDRNLVDILASRMSLDPEDLQRHFKHPYQRSELVPSNIDQIASKWVRDDFLGDSFNTDILPSEQLGLSKSMQFHGDWGDRSNVYFVEDVQGKNSTVLMLLRQRNANLNSQSFGRRGFNDEPLLKTYAEDEHIYIKVVASISKMSAADIPICDECPALYSYHVFRAWLLQRFNDSKLSFNPQARKLPHFEDIKVFHLLQRQRERLFSLQKSLQKRHFSGSTLHTGPQSSTIILRMEALIDDLETLHQRLELIVSEWHHFVDRTLIQAQLDEAEQSRSTAIGVASLTRVAAVYIPLNFAASFFDMNMSEFGNGTGCLWLFVITALIFAGFTAIPFTTQLLDWIHGRPTMYESPWTIILRLSYHFPIQGFWLAMFYFFHSVSLMHSVCQDGLYTILPRDGRKGYMNYIHKEHYFADFWRSRLKKIFEVTDNPDWQRRSFVSRIWVKLFSSEKLLPTASSPQ